MIDTLNIFILVSVTVILGYVGNTIFQKTRIPDVIWLLAFGVIVGPLLGFAEVSLYATISPLLVTTALLLILFDAGLNMNFYQLVNQAPRSILVAVINLSLVMLVVGFISHMWLGLNLLTGILLGAIVGGTSSPVVISITSKLKLKDNTKTLLCLESVITDVLCVVVSIAIIDILVSGNMGNIMNKILSPFSIGGVIGLLAGIVWLIMMDKIKGKPFDYILTLSVLLILFVFVETSGGSGAVAALLFGIVLGNGSTFSSILRLKKFYTVDEMVRNMQREISFFIRSFFFVFLGLVIVINQNAIIYGIVLSAIIITLRIIMTKISVIGYKIPEFDTKVIAIMAPRGLAAAVLAEKAVGSGLPGVGLFSTIIFMIIFSTIIFTTIATTSVYRKADEEEKNGSENRILARKKELTERSGKGR